MGFICLRRFCWVETRNSCLSVPHGLIFLLFVLVYEDLNYFRQVFGSGARIAQLVVCWAHCPA